MHHLIQRLTSSSVEYFNQKKKYTQKYAANEPRPLTFLGCLVGFCFSKSFF